MMRELEPDDVHALLQILEAGVDLDERAREHARSNMLRTAADPQSHLSGGFGAAELLRIHERRLRPNRPHRLLAAVAAVAVVIAGALLIVGGRARQPDAPASPTTTQPFDDAFVPGAIAPLEPGDLLSVGPQLMRIGESLVAFEVPSPLEVTAVAPGGARFVLANDAEFGDLVIALDPRFVDASNLEDWIEQREATVQQSFTKTAYGDALTTIVFSVAAPCDEPCPMFAVLATTDEQPLDVAIAAGTRTQIYIVEAGTKTVAVVAQNPSRATTVQDVASAIAQTIEVG